MNGPSASLPQTFVSVQLHLHEFAASQHDECIVVVTVLQDTSSGKHKIKIAGIVVSEGGEGIRNHMAVDMTAEGTSVLQAEHAQFEINKWINNNNGQTPEQRRG